VREDAGNMKTTKNTDSGIGEPQVAGELFSEIGVMGVVGDGDAHQRREIVSVAEFLAEIPLNRKTLYNSIRLGEIPGVRRVCGRILIHRPTVIEWFRTGQGAVPRSRRKS
jgi:hypothetical protein